MSLTEITTIGWKAPHAWGTDEVRDFVAKLRPCQTETSGHPLLWFALDSDTTPADSADSVIVTGWSSVAAHMGWVRDVGGPLLGPYAGRVLELRGQVHMDVEFETMPAEVGYLVWETREGTEAGERKEEGWETGCSWKATGRVADEGIEGMCTLWAFDHKPIGLELVEGGAIGGGVRRVGLVRLDGNGAS